MRLIWAEPALRDLSSLHSYIAIDNPPAAETQVAEILVAAEALTQFPNLGRPGRRAGTRELIVSRTPYLLPYRIRATHIEILRVLHSKRAWPDSFA